MLNRIEQGLPIRSEKDLGKIRLAVEREFARFLLLAKRKNPGLRIVYEPEFFEHKPNGKPEGTVPDFSVHNTSRPTSRKIYVEITTASKNGNGSGNGLQEIRDPKERQKRVMKAAAPDEKYVVLYRENLIKIQGSKPGIKFFKQVPV